MGVAEQLTDIYFKDEWWCKNKLSYADALQYHSRAVDRGAIYPHVENGEVLAYYEHYILGDTCFLHNVWVRGDQRRGRVFRALYQHFFSTMPREVTKVVGLKQKLGGILRERKIYHGR